jgi:hypothetical protein
LRNGSGLKIIAAAMRSQMRGQLVGSTVLDATRENENQNAYKSVASRKRGNSEYSCWSRAVRTSSSARAMRLSGEIYEDRTEDENVVDA